MAETKTKQDARIERVYNIPLRKSFRHCVRMKKANKAIRAVKSYLEKHMKSSDVRLGQEINHYIWSRGIRRPPHHVRVFAFKENGVVKAELEGHKWVEAIKPQKKTEDDKGGLAGKLQDLKASAAKADSKEDSKSTDTKSTKDVGEKKDSSEGKDTSKESIKDKESAPSDDSSAKESEVENKETSKTE